MPAFPNHTGFYGMPNIARSRPIVRGLMDGTVPIFEERNYTIAGVTKDSGGVPLGFCLVKLFNSVTELKVAQTTSDAAGLFSFDVDKTQTWYLVAYKPGGTDVAGTSLNTVVGL